ncbi:hypothetical protein F4805DRAFT_477278 [Annulohypoxylon moriforme]|nr:hypothetical protein F4805DRAFT_477278 [Annulohypoxylon moriforme]
MASSQGQASTGTSMELYKQHFPPEVFIVLLKNMPDYMVPYIWCTFRLVCKDWKAETEKVFREKYLSRMKIVVSSRYDLTQSELNFSRLSKDDAELRAFFHLNPADSILFHGLVGVESKVSQATTLYRPLNSPVTLATMGNVAISDPMLEEFVVDLETGEVSFLWIPMMNQLMGDEIRFRRGACKIVESSQHPKDETTKLEPNAEVEAMGKKVALYMVLRNNESMRAVVNQVRASRLRKQYALCGDTFVSTLDHVGVPISDPITELILSVRRRFRYSAYFLEL